MRIDEAALLESRSLRDSVAERAEVLDRVKVLTLLPDGMHVTSAMVASYFQVGIKAIRSLVVDHREELEGNGYRVLTGTELSSFKELTSVDKYAGSLALFSRRAVLNVAMLLRDSEVARQVRTYLLDVEQASRARPVDNPPTPWDEDWLDAKIVRVTERTIHSVLSRTVVPMLNVLIATSAEQRRDLIELRQDVDRIKDTLYNAVPGARRPELQSLMGPIDGMGWKDFEHYVAKLCRRDGCTHVEVRGGRDDLGADILARLPDGRRLVVQCKRQASHRSIPSSEMQQFIGTARPEHHADVALFVVPCGCTKSARSLAARHGITIMPRELLAAWNAGTKLEALLLRE
jgi:HJR/Mrr/RecB family endonuclease